MACGSASRAGESGSARSGAAPVRGAGAPARAAPRRRLPRLRRARRGRGRGDPVRRRCSAAGHPTGSSCPASRAVHRRKLAEVDAGSPGCTPSARRSSPSRRRADPLGAHRAGAPCRAARAARLHAGGEAPGRADAGDRGAPAGPGVNPRDQRFGALDGGRHGSPRRTADHGTRARASAGASGDGRARRVVRRRTRAGLPMIIWSARDQRFGARSRAGRRPPRRNADHGRCRGS